MPASQFRRKNGQQSSCENCRKSKLACDHVTPYCGRCVRLKRTGSCVYLVAPLTKSSKRLGVGKRATQVHSQPLASTISVALEPEIEAIPRDWLGLDGLSDSRPKDHYKWTNWGSIFDEFNIQVDPEPNDGSVLTWKDLELYQHATTALKKIPSREMCEGLLEHALNYPDFGCCEPYLRLLHEGWWEHFEGYLEESANTNQIIEQLWTNTANRVVDPLPSDSAKWLQSWTGVNTTWDSLAYLLSTYGSACASLPPFHPLLVNCGKSQVCMDLGKGIKACLTICELMEISRLNLINAHASMALLQNSYDGDDSKHNYTNIAQLARLIINIGLHNKLTRACFIQTQLEHKAFHRAFTLDKSIATSGGRPPQLTRRFNQCPLPLELSDEQLLLSGDDLEVVLNLLDSDGWSTSECVYPVSYLRALSMLSHHREEILELTMGPSSGQLGELQRDIVSRLHATFTGFPVRLQYDPNHHMHLGPFDFLNIIFLNLEYHKNIFLLYRLSRAMPLSQNQPLLSSAKAILDLMTMLYTNRGRLRDMFLFFPWAVMFYGTPAAAILAIELLVRPHCLPLIADGVDIHPRSEIIQELSVFISCLRSIPTTEGNYAPCQQVASTLHKILDQVLEPPMGTMTTTTTATATTTTTTPVTDVDSAIGLDIDWQVFVTGPCDPEYSQWLDPNTWADVLIPLD